MRRAIAGRKQFGERKTGHHRAATGNIEMVKIPVKTEKLFQGDIEASLAATVIRARNRKMLRRCKLKSCCSRYKS